MQSQEPKHGWLVDKKNDRFSWWRLGFGNSIADWLCGGVIYAHVVNGVQSCASLDEQFLGLFRKTLNGLD